MEKKKIIKIGKRKKSDGFCKFCGEEIKKEDGSLGYVCKKCFEEKDFID